MRERELLFSKLKEKLSEQSIAYSDLVPELGLSLSSVKRKLASQKLTLDELFKICRLLRIPLSRLTSDPALPVYRLSLHQEQVLVSDPKLFSFFWPLVHGVSIKRIRERFSLSNALVERFLIKLDRAEIVTYLGGGKFKLKVPSEVRWSPHGPIETRLLSAAIPKFLSEPATGDSATQMFFIAKLPKALAQQYVRQIEKLYTQLYQDSITQGLDSPDSIKVGFHVSFKPTTLSLNRFLARRT